MSRRLLLALVLAAATKLACAPEDVIVLRLPPATAGQASGGVAGSAGSEATGGAGTQAAGNESGGTAGGDAGGNAGSGASSPEGGSAGNPELAGSGGAGIGGGAGISGMSGSAGAESDCASNEDCPPSRVCSKSNCDAERGVCEPEPHFCEATPSPVCGCDNVTYWNDCVRRSAGVVASVSGECRAGAVSCQRAEDCPAEGALCARLLSRGDSCGPPGPGTCWVLPDGQCDPGDSRLWIECMPPGNPMPFPPPCVDTCSALMSDHPHIPARPDIPCP